MTMDLKQAREVLDHCDAMKLEWLPTPPHDDMEEALRAALAEVDRLMDERDALMLEYCPDRDGARATRELESASEGGEVMTPLPEIAVDVAQALALETYGEAATAWWPQHAWWPQQPAPQVYLSKDGSNLADPYWFKRCCEWMNTRKFVVTLGAETHMCDDYMKNRSVWAYCPLALAPAALVSAVLQQEKQR